MKQLKHVLAISAAALVAMASAVPLAEAGHGFRGGFGGGGFHAFGGRGFGGQGFHAFGGGARGFAVGPRGGLAFTGSRDSRVFIGPRGGVYAKRHYARNYFVHKGRHFHHGHRIFVPGLEGYYDSDFYNGGGCGWLYGNAIATGSPNWWNRYLYCVGNYD